MSSVSPVDSAIEALDHVWATTIQYFSYISCQPCWGGPVPCLLGKNCTCLFIFSTLRSFALWALLNCSFCVFCTSMSLCRIWHMLISFEGLEMTAPCAGRPWSISAGEGRSAKIGVSCSWSSALQLGYSEIHQFSCRCSWLSSLWPRWTIGPVEMRWWCGMHEVKFHEQTFWIHLH